MLSQVDMVFIADRLMKENPNLRPWQTKAFAWRHWVPVAGCEKVVQAAAAETQGRTDLSARSVWATLARAARIAGGGRRARS